MGRIVVLSTVAGCILCSVATGQIQFSDVTASAGIQAVNHDEYLISGQAWGDYNGDGLLDLYLTDNRGANHLYKNSGDGSFVLSDLSSQVALAQQYSGGANFVDFDNDGWDDLFVVNYGANTLFKNLSGQGFQDVTAQAGLGDIGRGESSAWADINQDGLLDLYVVNWYYVNEGSPFRKDVLYLQQPGGQFIDMSSDLDIPRMFGPGFAATFIDFDLDGDQDLYVINDKLYGNLLWRNDGPGCDNWCFTDISISSNAHRPVYGMGISVGDYDLDGDWDFYFSSIAEMVLLQSRIDSQMESFIEATDAAGVNHNAVGWGSVFADFNNDGWEDLFLSTIDGVPAQADRVFHNLGNGTFQDLSTSSGASYTDPSIGVAYADYDEDGRVDLVVGNYAAPYRLLRNTSSQTGQWLTVDVAAESGINRNAAGTLIRATLADGRVLMRQVTIGSSIGSGNMRRVHFGTGAQAVTQLEINWPDASQQIVQQPAMNQTFTLVRADPEAVFKDGFEF